MLLTFIIRPPCVLSTYKMTWWASSGPRALGLTHCECKSKTSLFVLFDITAANSRHWSIQLTPGSWVYRKNHRSFPKTESFFRSKRLHSRFDLTDYFSLGLLLPSDTPVKGQYQPQNAVSFPYFSSTDCSLCLVTESLFLPLNDFHSAVIRAALLQKRSAVGENDSKSSLGTRIWKIWGTLWLWFWKAKGFSLVLSTLAASEATGRLWNAKSIFTQRIFFSCFPQEVCNLLSVHGSN